MSRVPAPLLEPIRSVDRAETPEVQTSMRRLRFSLLPLVALVALSFTAAFAATSGAHFMSASATINDQGALVVNWDEAGLGNENIDYTLTADATAVYACINGGNNHPKAANKETVQGQVSTGGSFQAKNGRVQASLTTGPLSAGSFSCPSGQRLVLASVSYSNIVLTDTTNNVSVTLPDVSRTFFAI
jgi:hypothetical protein